LQNQLPTSAMHGPGRSELTTRRESQAPGATDDATGAGAAIPGAIAIVAPRLWRFCARAYIRPRRLHLSSRSSMDLQLVTPATITQSTPAKLLLAGAWTTRGLDAIGPQIAALGRDPGSAMVVDSARIEALDTAGAWVLQKLLQRLRGEGEAGGDVQLLDLRPEFARLLEVVGQAIVLSRRARLPVRSTSKLGGPRAQQRVAVARTGPGVARLHRRGCVRFRRLRRSPIALQMAADAVQPAPRRLRRPADRRAAVVPAGNRRRLSGRRPAAAVRRHHLRRRPRRPLHAARIRAADHGDHHRRALGIGLCGANWHHVGDRGDRRAAHARNLAAGAAGAPENLRPGRSPCPC
jgi:hypothetical protein